MPPTECIYQVSNWYLKARWKKVRKTGTDGRTDGRTDGQTDGHCHSIIRPFFKRAYKKVIHRMTPLGHRKDIETTQIAKFMGTTWGPPGPLFTKKTPSHRYRDPHEKPKRVWRPSQVYNGNPYTDKMAFSQWIEALGPVGPRWAPYWPHEPCYQGSYGQCISL